MNYSIELQDEGGKETTIIVKGKRNNQILFEENFDYSDENKCPLRLYLLKEHFMRKYFAERKTLAVMSIRKLLRNIMERSKFMANPDYKTIDKSNTFNL
ncbi:hypothetical protein EZS27_034248 [termite gut metagenome]|uniref:Uncharacterized protein n=1 Tax=termite gut metagenome TaxID=433724 RepID=A0A5J4Q0N9_9ZZZZ